ncbi:LacI family transcriptional regulator [Protaetiibacter intestinalis]|uniref:LacI family transcriptional regulator n=2 Tax=Protaetiibacter intestinalis TaxID=2419774 RepID=A0A387BEC8_9MICO|nr:LacI family transcriptional regulator [Protaetiibacter intestinalis]
MSPAAYESFSRIETRPESGGADVLVVISTSLSRREYDVLRDCHVTMTRYADNCHVSTSLRYAGSMKVEGMRRRPPTSKDVAQLAGVSRSTVSQIFNRGSDRFDPATVKRVTDAAAELDYRPSQAGRNLASGRSSTVVVLVPDTTFSYNLQDMVDRITADVQDFSMNVVLRFFRIGRDDVTPLLEMQPFAVMDFAGLSPRDVQRLARNGTAVVPDDRRSIRVGVDDVGRAQVDLLAECRVGRLLYARLRDERSDPYGPPRADAVRRRAEERGLPKLEIVEVPLDVEGAQIALAPYLVDGTAIAAYNDDVAIAVLGACVDLGFDVPRQVRVVGVDHTRIGQLVRPRLSTIAMKGEELVDEVVKQLRAVAEHRDVPPIRVTGIARPVVGDTT